MDTTVESTVNGLYANAPTILGTGLAFTSLAGITTILRFVSKRLAGIPFGWDDWTALLAYVFYFVTEVLLLRSVFVGRTATLTDLDALSTYVLYVYVYSIFYFQIMGLCIASVLLLYRRIFTNQFMQRATLFLLIVLFCWWVPSTILETGQPAAPRIFPGDPNDSHWHAQYLTFWLISGIIELVMIIVATLLPLRQIYKLQLNRLKRTILTFIFALTYLCVITGICRLAILYRPAGGSFDLSVGDVWLSVHCGIAVMSNNLTCCWPLVSRSSEIVPTLLHKLSLSSIFGRGTVESDSALESSTMRRAKSERSSLPEEQFYIASLLDPRRTTSSWTQASRVASNERNTTALQNARQVEAGEAIEVTKTVQVHNEDGVQRLDLADARASNSSYSRD